MFANLKQIYLNQESRKILIINHQLLLNIQVFNKNLNSIQSYCLGGRHFSETVKENVYEKVNPKTRKLVKIINRNCNICGRNKSQIFSK